MSILERFEKNDIRSNKLHKEVALEALQVPETLPEIAACLSSQNKLVRAAGAGTLAELTLIRPESGIPFVDDLKKALLESPEAQTRWESINALGNIGVLAPEKVEDIIPAISDSLEDKKSACVRGYAVIALGKIGSSGPKFAERVLPSLKKAMTLFTGTNDVGYVIEALAGIALAHPPLGPDVEKLIRPFQHDDCQTVVKKTKRSLKKMGLNP